MERQKPDMRRRRRKQPPRWIALAVVVVIAVGGYLLFSGGGPAARIKDIITGPEPVPEFGFEITKVAAVPTDDTEARTLERQAEEVSAEVAESLDLLYVEGFLNPNNWKDAAYDTVWEVFSEEALAAAQEQADTFTLGAAAPDSFKAVAPDRGKLAVKVLFDAKGQPVTAVATVKFLALATNSGGTTGTAIVSEGQYFLRDAGDGWEIYAFSVDRADREARLPSPSASASASAEAS